MSKIAQLQRMNIGAGFRAFALRGGEMAEPIDPFLGVDHARMSEATFQTHPHAGFSAVSYLFLDSETGVNNMDSLGTRNLIQPGGLHWTAAGRGVVHNEVPAVSGKMVHMLQIFVNLSVEKQHNDPFSLSLEPQDVPVVQFAGVKVRVPLGSFADATSPLQPPTEVRLLDISLDADAELSVPIPAGHSAFVMPIHGSVEINRDLYDANDPRLPVFPAEGVDQSVTLRAKGGNAKVVVFSGKPLRQPVYWQGPLAMASTEALAERIAAYQRGEFGTV